MRLIATAVTAAVPVLAATGSNRLAHSSQPKPPRSLQSPAIPQPVSREQLSQLKSKDPVLRRNTATEMGAMRAKAAVKPLRDLLFDGDAGVREAAAFALGQIADPAATKSLIYVLADKDPRVRASAAFALGMLGDTAAADDLSNVLDDQEADVRGSAIFALGLMHDDSAVDEIIDALSDSSFDVRYDAVWALGQIGDQDAIEPLRTSLLGLELIQSSESSKEAFRQAVQSALDGIQGQSAGSQGSSGRPRRAGGTTPDLGHVSRFPAVRQSVTAAKTEAAVNAGLKATVSLKILVAADGRAARAYVSRRAGYGLDRRAVEAILQYKFDPGLRDGLPQSEWMSLDLQFPAK